MMNNPDLIKVVEAENQLSVGEKSRFSKFRPSWTTTIIIIYIILSFILNGAFNPLTRRGFFCGDSTINYPIKPDTVGLKTLLILVLVIPSVVITFFDKFLIRLLDKRPHQEVDAEEKLLISSNIASPKFKRRQLTIDEDCSLNELTRAKQTANIGDISDENDEVQVNQSDVFSTVPLDSDGDETNGIDLNRRKTLILSSSYFHRNFTECQLYLFGAGTTMLLTGIGKITTGRLRPHFMQVCRPDVDCGLETNRDRYIENFLCVNDISKHPNYSYITTSWPSGHSSIIFYSMIYIIIYLNTTIPLIVQLCQEKIKERYNPLAFHALYVLMIAMACYVSMSRVSDFHHHPMDVISGAIIGITVALGLSRYILSRQYSSINF